MLQLIFPRPYPKYQKKFEIHWKDRKEYRRKYCRPNGIVNNNNFIITTVTLFLIPVQLKVKVHRENEAQHVGYNRREFPCQGYFKYTQTSVLKADIIFRNDV